MSHNTNKLLAATIMLDAFGHANRAYYLDSTPTNLAALQACRTAVERMLEPYYMEEETRGKE